MLIEGGRDFRVRRIVRLFEITQQVSCPRTRIFFERHGTIVERLSGGVIAWREIFRIVFQTILFELPLKVLFVGDCLSTKVIDNV